MSFLAEKHVLTVDTSQIASREKYCSCTAFARNRGLFTKMQKSIRNSGKNSYFASTMHSVSIYFAVDGTKGTGFHLFAEKFGNFLKIITLHN